MNVCMRVRTCRRLSVRRVRARVCARPCVCVCELESVSVPVVCAC